MGKYHCTIDLLCDLFGLACFANKNRNCKLSYNWFQTSQTGGQWYSDTSPFSIPWFVWPGLCSCCVCDEEIKLYKIDARTSTLTGVTTTSATTPKPQPSSTGARWRTSTWGRSPCRRTHTWCRSYKNIFFLCHRWCRQIGPSICS